MIKTCSNLSVQPTWVLLRSSNSTSRHFPFDCPSFSHRPTSRNPQRLCKEMLFRFSGNIPASNVPMVGTLFSLALTLGLISFGMDHKISSIILVTLLGAAAFNLSNALGAWPGGVVIDHGPGLNSLFLIAAVLPLIAIGVIGFSTQVFTAEGGRYDKKES